MVYYGPAGSIRWSARTTLWVGGRKPRDTGSNRSCPLSKLISSSNCSEFTWRVEDACGALGLQTPPPLKCSILELFQTFTFSSLFLFLALSIRSAPVSYFYRFMNTLKV